MFNTIYFNTKMMKTQVICDCGCKEYQTTFKTQKLAVLGLSVAHTIVWISPFHFKVRAMRRFQLDNQHNKQAG